MGIQRRPAHSEHATTGGLCNGTHFSSSTVTLACNRSSQKQRQQREQRERHNVQSVHIARGSGLLMWQHGFPSLLVGGALAIWDPGWVQLLWRVFLL
mmetsp:Transcript_8735/g.16552  ORF Transcript_8735/g.16552 Transcript_8735/m.16552 type:complete len:97 (+) Transcript_8735:2934-3224(+)